MQEQPKGTMDTITLQQMPSVDAECPAHADPAVMINSTPASPVPPPPPDGQNLMAPNEAQAIMEKSLADLQAQREILKQQQNEAQLRENQLKEEKMRVQRLQRQIEEKEAHVQSLVHEASEVMAAHQEHSKTFKLFGLLWFTIAIMSTIAMMLVLNTMGIASFHWFEILAVLAGCTIIVGLLVCTLSRSIKAANNLNRLVAYYNRDDVLHNTHI